MMIDSIFSKAKARYIPNAPKSTTNMAHPTWPLPAHCLRALRSSGGDGYTVFTQGTDVQQPGDDLLQVPWTTWPTIRLWLRQ